MSTNRPTILKATQISELVQRVLRIYNEKKGENDERVIVSLAGVPGSGKTTLASEVIKELNKQVKSVLVSQDGFHYYRSELTKFSNPEEAFRRRGAPFTFNAHRFLNLVKQLRCNAKEREEVRAPSFDHRLKDPVEEDIVISPNISVVLLEGNYVALGDPIWSEISKTVDEIWFISSPAVLVRERLIQRHLDAGIASTQEEAVERAEGSDLINAKYIEKNSLEPNVIILSE